ncbi:TPA: UDP-N-acetylglucosamine 2-epimerase (hydrolyzing) [Citrobacter sedlakii]|nr:UDP-N-acetylglucosamine 2-epimerase (hydrolyzing) [Citrobacter sedlakii]EKX8507937.1 UDP-N-acetylglucosamine 2-epimerase (hydrolyzing) [Citrobacter sedlakii]HCA7077529.1 UDP-N-acetylglucosamine 2-epimerase (hydrolyzing) [Citrobacter sedlakii]HCA7081558.1 UDP-N-acetylglucosamine 2-epimerase (hydrolyzing) [Citrobacter sedlakii]HCA7134872.1 UDP-N-acetylglucosamine 2-epimerase (hydrolyzing) [Citrobacter sedlakii]
MKIAVFTGTRAEYGLLYWLMKDIQAAPDLQLQLLVSGMHLSPEFGLTWQQIAQDGFHIDEKIETLLSSDTAVGVAKSVGLGILGFTDALSRQQPDLLIVLGDRFEALAAAQTAMLLRIPVLHLHGGEITEGAYDDAIRHAITKLSTLHGVATEESRRRVIQLGEDPVRVVNVGAVGLDHLQRSPLLSRQQLAAALNFTLSRPYFVVTYHPVTLAEEPPEASVRTLIAALSTFPDHQIILTWPNADDGGKKIISLLEEWAGRHSQRILARPSLGQQRYLSAVKHAAAVIGNSSSGIIEAPALNTPSVNIGDRQQGRLAANSVIHCAVNREQIIRSINDAVSRRYMKPGAPLDNPYGQGDASGKILSLIRSAPLSCQKTFYDLK